MTHERSSSRLLDHALSAWDYGFEALKQCSALSQLDAKDGRAYFGDEPLFANHGRLHVLAMGKCAHHLARAAIDRLGHLIVGGFVVSQADQRLKPPWIQSHGGHPSPNGKSVKTAEKLCHWLEALKPSDQLIILMSGGASAMVERPAPGWSLDELARARMDDLSAGMPVDRINHRAAARSQTKNGGLARRTACPWRQLTINDVGDGVDGLVSSGPFLGLCGRDITLANHRTAAVHAIYCLERQGYRVWSGPTLYGEARQVGAKLHVPDGYDALVQSGETTVRGPYHGMGGRNLELVGGWIEASKQTTDWAIVSGSSDGFDGNSQAAGAYWTSADSVDHRALALAMAEHNTAPWFQSADRLLKKKASISHVGDLLILVRAENRFHDSWPIANRRSG